jgi:hypothetical protein
MKDLKCSIIINYKKIQDYIFNFNNVKFLKKIICLNIYQNKH